MGAAKVYSFEDVKKHNNKDDCWLVIFGKVYDVTPFLEEHPGGDHILLEANGKDATSDFEDVIHSQYAYNKLEELYIGDHVETFASEKHNNNNSPPQTASASDKEDLSKTMLYLLSFFIIGLAIFLRLYTT